MPFCQSCGSSVPEEALFCGTCGKPLARGFDRTLSEQTQLSDADQRTLPGSGPGLAQAQEGRSSGIKQNEPVDQGDERESGTWITPLPFSVQPATLGQIPGIAGTPTATGVPSLPGTPVAQTVPSVPGTPQAPGAPSTQMPVQPGNAASGVQPGQPPSPPSTASHPAQTGASRASQRGALRRAASKTASRGASKGAATTGGVAVAVKVVVGIIVAVVVAAGAATAVPRILHHSNAQQGGAPTLTTQPMPATQTSCPAANTARAMVSRPLAGGKHQTLVILNNGNLQRYDPGTQRFTTLVQAQPGVISEAQVSPDGAWILFISQINKQAAIQMVRMDGQGVQTLYCAPVGQSIFSFSWSPGGETIAFNQGVNFLQPGTVGGGADTFLLQLKTGKLQAYLVQPHYGNTNQNGEVGYTPFYWLDATHLYMKDYTRCCVGDYYPYTFYLLDLSRGPNQAATNLLKVFAQHSSLQGMALSPDRSKLFVSDCPCGFNQWQGPSPISVLSPMGGQASTVYTDARNAIITMAIAGQNSVLVVLGTNGATNQDGLWKIDLTSQKETQLVPLDQGASFNMLLNTNVQYPWSNVSRDGGMYAVLEMIRDQTATITGARLYIGSLQGGQVLTTLTLPAHSDFNPGTITNLPLVVGWTTT